MVFTGTFGTQGVTGSFSFFEYLFRIYSHLLQSCYHSCTHRITKRSTYHISHITSLLSCLFLGKKSPLAVRMTPRHSILSFRIHFHFFAFLSSSCFKAF